MKQTLFLAILLGFVGCATQKSMTIDRDALHDAIMQHRIEIRNCYETELNRNNPKLEGKLVLDWVIDPNGMARDIKVNKSTINNKNLEDCVSKIISQTQFPKSEGPPLTIQYPFGFSPVK